MYVESGMGPRLASDAVRVPFLDLAPSHEDLKDAILADIADLIDAGAFTNGPQVAAFESDFAGYCGTRACVGVASGLDALRFALLAAGIEPGDEVVVPANTFVATAEAVSQAGGTPVLVDADERDYCLDVSAIEGVLSERTRFVMPVHLYGQLADMRALTALAERRGLDVIADACQAHGATREGIGAADACRAAAFSFYPGKNLGAMGDAGALTTDDEELAVRVRALREHGQTAKYHHELQGYTSRLDTIQAIVLAHKLPHLDGWNDERRGAALHYLEALEGVGDLLLPPVAPASDPVWHLFVVRTADPVSLGAFLSERGIGASRHYPEPIHLTDAYASLGYAEGAFPVSERLARECLSLPIFPGITEEQLERVVTAVRAYFDRG
jgi:dTDP-4-amino-4,6-dideoxygalactose transaminase